MQSLTQSLTIGSQTLPSACCCRGEFDSMNSTPSTTVDQMSATYEKLGVQFMYPENWEIMDEDPHAEPRSVAAHNETGAFWSVTIYKSDVEADDVAAAALAALREEYEELESQSVSEDLGPLPSSGYDAQFYVQQLVAAARIRTFTIGDETVLLLCQAEDREFERLSDVFQAMTLSFLQTV